MKNIQSKTALIIVDMQKYYLLPESDYCRYFEQLSPGCLDFIRDRCRNTVIPNIQRLSHSFRQQQGEILYLRLCGEREDRSDLHRFFHETYLNGLIKGFPAIYPLSRDPMSDVLDELKPLPTEVTLTKTTFSAFNSTDIETLLKSRDIGNLVFTGLATSQCVETTARDASDRGFCVIHLDDAQADYDEMTHNASLYSSIGVCGGNIMTTDAYLEGF